MATETVMVSAQRDTRQLLTGRDVGIINVV
jgi:hypothetical protein